MIPVIFINCTTEPYIDDIMGRLKEYETRNRNTLGRFLGERVLLAETGHGLPLIKCSAVIDQIISVSTKEDWEEYLEMTWVPVGSKHDWQPNTKIKWLYHLSDVQPVKPFRLPPSCRRHGRVWAEYVPDDLTDVCCVYTGGGIYVYQARYNGYWIYGSLDGCMDAYSYEPFKYWKDTDSSESPEEYRVNDAIFPTWAEVIRSLNGPDAEIGGDCDECISIIKECQSLDKPVNIE